ncbi:MAG: hypothetical protein JW751_24970 [Polyangiaceae bacterium]|nr:hypothetical protein [Polyangiaceae bacterium]
MSERGLTPIIQEGFTARADVAGERLVFKLTGTGDMAAVKPLERALHEIHAEVAHRGLRAVDIDITALYLLNSSCLKALVSFIYAIMTAGPRYDVRFLTDARLSWQTRSLSVVARMAPELVSITAKT